MIATTFDAPNGRAALVARWLLSEVPDDAMALLGDAANSVRLALERDEAEEAHQQAAALRRSHQLQRDFLSRLSHELRTPLTAIRGYASSLLASDVTWDDQSKMRFLNRIEGESSRLGRLVGDLLDFSAIESGLLRLQQDWCDLPLVIEAAVSCLHPGGADAVTVSCPAEIGPLWADHDRLEQVFVNLLDNALRHNSPEVKIKVEVAEAGTDSVSIRVSDDGKGIPKELKEQLFESWPGRHQRSGGGAWPVNCQRHRSRPRRSHKPRGHRPGSVLPDRAAARGPGGYRPMTVVERRTKALLVEDDPNIVDLIRSNLTVRGFDTCVSPDGSRPFNCWRPRHPTWCCST